MTSRTEGRIAELARGQHGLVTRAQLLGIGLGADAVKYRLEALRLCPVQRGVYRVGPLAAPLEKEMAAVLACGSGATVSHGSAAALWGLRPPSGPGSPVHVTVRAPDRRRRPGVVVHRGRAFAPDEVEAVHGIPATSPARTLLDLAGAVRLRELEQMIARADRRGLASRDTLVAAVARRPGRPGVRALRAVLREGQGPPLTRSEAEARLLALLRRARLPRPEVNVVLGPHEVDLLWRAQRLAVEVDGFAFHAARRAFEDDRRRDGDLAARGYRVVRVTWRQIVDEPEALLVRLAQTLARPMPQ